MTTAPSIEHLTAQLNAEEQGYEPSDEVRSVLRQKTMIPVLGPFAIGKSTVMRAAEAHADFGRVRSFTTRSPRIGEAPDQYTFLPHTTDTLRTLLDDAKNRSLVQLMVHPTTQHVYGTRLEEYGDQKYVMLDVIPKALPGLEALKFGDMQKVELVAEPDVWLPRMRERFQDNDPQDIRNRLAEGVDNLRWALDQGSDIAWINNGNRDARDTAEELTEVARYGQQDRYAREVGYRLLCGIMEFEEQFTA